MLRHGSLLHKLMRDLNSETPRKAHPLLFNWTTLTWIIIILITNNFLFTSGVLRNGKANLTGLANMGEKRFSVFLSGLKKHKWKFARRNVTKIL